MKKQLILLLIASTVISNVDAAAQRFYNWCVNNRSRIALTSTALSSGAAAYYWKNRKLQPIYDRNSVYPIRSKSKPEDFFPPIRKEDIQICGNKPGQDRPIESIELKKYLSRLPKQDKRTEHEKIREGIQRRKKTKEEERQRDIEEILRQRSSSCDNCK